MPQVWLWPEVFAICRLAADGKNLVAWVVARSMKCGVTELACVLLPLAFVLHPPSQRTVPQGQSQSTMAVKGGSGPQQANKICQTLLSELPRNWLETFHLLAFLTCLRPLAASFRPAQLRSKDSSAGPKHHGVRGGSGGSP